MAMGNPIGNTPKKATIHFWKKLSTNPTLRNVTTDDMINPIAIAMTAPITNPDIVSAIFAWNSLPL
jgi:hypothetical protein